MMNLIAQVSVNDTGLNTTANSAGFAAAGNIETIIANAIQTVLGLVGVIILLLFIYAGFLWMTAGGNEETVGKAKNIIKNAIIGLIIVLAAYSITYFISTTLGTAATTNSTVSNSTN